MFSPTRIFPYYDIILDSDRMRENMGHRFCPSTGKYWSKKTLIQQNTLRTISNISNVRDFVSCLILQAKFYDNLLIIN